MDFKKNSNKDQYHFLFLKPLGKPTVTCVCEVPELGTHDVVEDRINGGVDVEHDPREVQDVVVALKANLHD